MKLNKKKILKLIIILVIIEIICIILISFVFKNKNSTNASVQTKLSEIEKIDNNYQYKYFNATINKLFKYISEQNSNAIISILDDEYVKSNKLNSKNVLQHFKEYGMITEYTAKQVYSQKIEWGQSYKGEYNYIEGSIEKEGKEESMFFLVKQDYINSTFSLTIINEKTFKNVSKSTNINNNLEMNIKRNDYNTRNVEIDNNM